MGDTLNVPGDYSTISEGISFASPSDIVWIANGIYSSSANGEVLPLDLPNSIRIIGESKEGVILDGEEQSSLLEITGKSDLYISNLTITRGTSSQGGGISCFDSELLITNVTISLSTATHGGGLYSDNSVLTLKEVEVLNNSVFAGDGGGGGGLCFDNSIVELQYVVISWNNVTSRFGEANGGGIYSENSNVSLINSVVSNNHAFAMGEYGEGLYFLQSSTRLLNTIVWNNGAHETDNRIYFNAQDSSEYLLIAFSDVQGGLESIWTDSVGTIHWMENNIDTDPLYLDSDSGDYHLSDVSPCVDAGTAIYTWEGDTLVNLMLHEYASIAPDMGRYEYHPLLHVKNRGINPQTYLLLQNFPNPFNPSTTISYDLQEQSEVSLTIYDISGREVAILKHQEQPAGHYQTQWSGVDELGNPVSNGVYFARLQAGLYSKTIKMVYLK